MVEESCLDMYVLSGRRRGAVDRWRKQELITACISMFRAD